MIYNIQQDVLFLFFLLSTRKKDNLPLILYFSFNLLTTAPLLVVSQATDASPWYFDLLYFGHAVLVMALPAVVVKLLYSLRKVPQPKAYYLLWILPVVKLILVLASPEYPTEDSFTNDWYLDFGIYVKLIFAVVLIILLREFQKDQKENSTHRSHIELIRFHWARYLLYFKIFFTYTSLLYLFLVITNEHLFHIDALSLGYSNLVYLSFYLICEGFFMFVFGYLALRNPTVFRNEGETMKLEQRIAEIVLPQEDKSLNPSNFSEEQHKRFSSILNELVVDKKIFLDPDLSLKSLSETAGIPARQLSQFIKEHFQKSYKEYINELRINHACELLLEQNTDPMFKMYTVALESGFNSESLFYRLFKEQKGMTPKQFQESNN